LLFSDEFSKGNWIIIARPASRKSKIFAVADIMALLRLDHIQLAMPPGGEDRARAFYGALLGLPEVEKPPHLAKRGGCWFERGDLKVHLGVEKGFTPARKAHPAFLASDLSSLIAKLKAAGVEPAPDQPLEGYERVYVSDPFGNRIELMERLKNP
jgi:catechol 2,3-dioxygenase-like lactoylglutathione lyase family enzyme